MNFSRLSRWLLLGGLLLSPAWGQTPTEAEEEKESQLVGVERVLDAETYMGLAIEGNALMLRFYDEEKQLIDPVAARAAAWWKPVNRSGRERVVLNPADDGLRSPPKVRPPHVFFVMLTLLDEAGEPLGTHRFDMVELQTDGEGGAAAAPTSPGY